MQTQIHPHLGLFSNGEGMMEGALEIKDAEIEDYRLSLQEHSRPPSRGGNSKARHRHALIINGEEYSFFVNGRLQWVHKGDRVSFQYEIKGQHKNILTHTIQTLDSKGEPIVRGERGLTKKCARRQPECQHVGVTNATDFIKAHSLLWTPPQTLQTRLLTGLLRLLREAIEE